MWPQQRTQSSHQAAWTFAHVPRFRWFPANVSPWAPRGVTVKPHIHSLILESRHGVQPHECLLGVFKVQACYWQHSWPQAPPSGLHTGLFLCFHPQWGSSSQKSQVEQTQRLMICDGQFRGPSPLEILYWCLEKTALYGTAAKSKSGEAFAWNWTTFIKRSKRWRSTF